MIEQRLADIANPETAPAKQHPRAQKQSLGRFPVRAATAEGEVEAEMVRATPQRDQV